jgi:hypothetical protein
VLFANRVSGPSYWPNSLEFDDVMPVCERKLASATLADTVLVEGVAVPISTVFTLPDDALEISVLAERAQSVKLAVPDELAPVTRFSGIEFIPSVELAKYLTPSLYENTSA